MPAFKRWRATWDYFGVAEADESLYRDVIARYCEPARHYHTLRHLDECFAKLPELRDATVHIGEIELALWFHDAVYDVSRADNEARSAERARAAALARHVPADAAERIHSLILATRHAAIPSERDAQVVVDVDLSILASAPERFDEYERQIRAEYAAYPDAVYSAGRQRVLDELLARPRIYSTTHFQERYEEAARVNIARALARLVPA